MIEYIWHGFFWRHAAKHYCEDCSDNLVEQVGFPPCGECRTQPCTRGGDCWAAPPLHLFPYETFWSTPAERYTCDASLLPWLKLETQP